MSAPGHPLEQLVDLVDQRLGDAEAAEVRRHLEGCAECRRELEWLTAGRAAARLARSADPVPPDLEAAVIAAIDEVDPPAAPAVPTRPGTPSRRLIWTGLAAAAVLLLVVAVPWRQATADAVDRAHERYLALGDQSLTPEIRTTDAATLERALNASNQGPRVRVIDLAMMGWTIEGGERLGSGNESGVLYVYRSATGARLMCEMFEGRLTDLPAADTVRRENGFEFRVYVRGGVTLVFWQEGELVCVLAGDGSTADVVDLAIAKAMAPA